MHHGFAKNYNAGGTIAARTIVKFGADSKTILAAAAATDKLIGVSCDVDAVSGDPVDVQKTGIALVKAGGSVTRGDLITSDASGNAVSAAPATGIDNRIIGFAEEDAASGDIFNVMLSPGQIQGQ